MGQALLKPVRKLVSFPLPRHSGVRTVTAAIAIVPEWIWINWWDLTHQKVFQGSESISLTQICREICRFICLWIKGRKGTDKKESYIAKIRYDDR